MFVLLLFPDFSVRGGVRLYLALGRHWPQQATLRVKLPPHGIDAEIRGVAFTERSFAFPLYYETELAWQPEGTRLSFGLRVIHAKVYARPWQSVRVTGRWPALPLRPVLFFRDLIPSFSISHGLNHILAGAEVQIFRKGRVEADLLFYGGGALAHTEITLQGIHREHYEWDGPAGAVGMRVLLRPFRHLALACEYRYSAVRLHHLDVPGGWIATTIRSHHFVAGPMLEW